MIRVIAIWLMLSAAIGFGILAFRQLSGKEKWELTKLIACATMCSLIAVVVLGIIVAVF